MMEQQEYILLPAAELAAKHEVEAEVYEGVKAANNWKEGKKMEEKEFLAAVDAFKNSPADGRDKEARG